MNHILTLTSINDTIKLGKILGNHINERMVIALDGDLGCGKTHLTKGLALGLNIKENIKSPTFNLINEYNEGKIPLYHFDVYRLESLDELFLIGFDDYINENALVVIEWASLVKEALPQDTNYINIYKNESSSYTRIINFNFSKSYEYILKDTIKEFKEELKDVTSNS